MDTADGWLVVVETLTVEMPVLVVVVAMEKVVRVRLLVEVLVVE